MSIVIPPGYKPILEVRRTVDAIKRLKDVFEVELAHALRLTRVSAPLFVPSGVGINDTLSGVERPVRFDCLETGEVAEIVHSLAKWKRDALGRYGFTPGEGIYTDMNAIRRDEVTDNTHSIYVDQWDWELVLTREQRTVETLKDIVRRIYGAFLSTERIIVNDYPTLERQLPENVSFMTAQELEDMYPDLTPDEREYRVCRERGSVFLMAIGGAMSSGKPHGSRSPDYDDWELNGDLLFYYKTLDIAMEMQSMGIRVDAERMLVQLHAAGKDDWANLPFHRAVLSGELPLTAGGGIGQSRMCMFFLQKASIGEVHCSVWPREMIEACRAAGVPLL